jgi:tRNA(fMet)-specific endonuclease VapC
MLEDVKQTSEAIRAKEGAAAEEQASVVVSLGGLSNWAGLPTRCFVSAITLAELSVGPLVAITDVERSARQSVLQQVEADFHPIPFDDRAARAFGRVAAELRASGRKTTARAYDALIAATAVANDLPVFTRNPDDFGGIELLAVVTLDVVS